MLPTILIFTVTVSCYLGLALLHWLHEALPQTVRDRLLALLYLAVAISQAASKLLN